MNRSAKILRTCANVWFTLALLAIGIGYLGILVTQGFWELIEIMSPWNMWNNFAFILALAPGALLWWLSEKFSK